MNRMDAFEIDCPVRSKRHFTPEEATRSLVLLRRIIADVVGEYGRLLDLHEAVDAAQDCDAGAATLDAMRRKLVASVDRLHHCVDELDAMGVELKDWTTGIVDFPSRIGGREVRLCWQYGEQEVSRWHPVRAGCSEREPLETIEPAHSAVAGGG